MPGGTAGSLCLHPGGGTRHMQERHTPRTALVGKSELGPGRVLDKSAASESANMLSRQLRPDQTHTSWLGVPLILPPNSAHHSMQPRRFCAHTHTSTRAPKFGSRNRFPTRQGHRRASSVGGLWLDIGVSESFINPRGSRSPLERLPCLLAWKVATLSTLSPRQDQIRIIGIAT
jgi:hypothetical protein